MNQNINLDEQLKSIAGLFNISGEFESQKVLTAGNINATYKLTYKDGDKTNYYILQRVNTYVFKKPEEIMSNINLVTKHILNSNSDQQTLVFYNTADGKNYYNDGNGNFWRLCDNIDSVSLDSCDKLEVLEAVGAAFGQFQNILASFDAAKLYETIPDFHNTKKRLEKLFASIEKDECDRVKEAASEIAFIKENAELASTLTNMLEAGDIPLRVTHNDTKFNNVLFDKVTNLPIAIIDLDTVMPGLAMADFGDAVRFACSTAAEDEQNVSIVALDVDKFTAFAKGFVGNTKSSLTANEINTMVLGAITITIELAVRFLDDYLTGDKYFKTLYPGHNLVRTRCQLALAKDMLKKRDELEAIIKDIAR